MFSSIPLPQALSPGESLNNFRAQTNALSKQQMENRQLQAQGNLTQQQANFTPYQYATQALSNPNIWLGEGGKEAATNLINQLPALAKLGINAGGSNNLGQLDSASLGKMLLQKLSNVFNKGEGSGQSGSSNSLNNMQGSNNYAPGGQAPNGVPNTPAAIAAQQNGNGLNMTPSPIATSATNTKAQEENVLGSVRNQTAEQKESNDIINKNSPLAIDAEKANEGWKRNYDKSTYKGQYLGSHPTAGKGSIPNAPGHNNSPEQLAENYANKLVNIVTSMEGQSGGMTDLGRELISNAKGVGLHLDEDAAKEMYESNKYGFQRLKQQRNFSDNFFKNNPTATKEDFIAMLNEYNKNAPPYDYESGKPLPENNKKFKDFTSRQALQSYMENGEYNPYEGRKQKTNSFEDEKNELRGLPEGNIQEVSMHNGHKAYMINGEWYGV